jgi:CoA-transferase family III
MSSVSVPRVPPSCLDGPKAVAALARSGIMALTGWPSEAPCLPTWELPCRLASLTGEIEQVTARQGRRVRVSWEAAVAGRAVILGLHRRGQTSANGSCRLLPAANGWVALNLPRPDDLDLIPALTRRAGSDAWADARSAAAVTPAGEFAAQARLLGLAAAPLRSVGPTSWYESHPRWGAQTRDGIDPWQVVDLSSLWAGPLVSRVLAEAGAAVTKVESSGRPDGARAIPNFYHWLHSPKETVVKVDFSTHVGRRRAAELINEADVVIEASRPRALEQLGLGPDDSPKRAGRVWLSITGYGRDAPGRDFIAFGDDAAVAGGLVAWDAQGNPVFCGDAIADPITGLVGALAVLRAREGGGGQLIDLAMSRAAAAAVSSKALPGGPAIFEPDGDTGWLARVGPYVEPVRGGPESIDLILPVGRSGRPRR